MSLTGTGTDDQGKPKGLPEQFDWQLDHSVNPPRFVGGIAGLNSGTYTAITSETIDSNEAIHVFDVKGLFARKITVSGDTVYVATAVIGSAQASAIWRAKKIDTVGADTTVTWADGDSSFDNVATDLTSLSYS